MHNRKAFQNVVDFPCAHCYKWQYVEDSLLSESQAIVLFPATMAGKTSKYLLDSYFGLDKKQIEKVKKVKTRAIVIMRTYPMVIVTENIVVPLNKFL